MTPKEKAEYLVDKYYLLLKKSKGHYEFPSAIQCAIVAVDEILKLHIFKYNSVELFKYWQQVKEEIEKL